MQKLARTGEWFSGMVSYSEFGEAQFTMEIPGMLLEDGLVSLNACVMPALTVILVGAVDDERHVRVLVVVVRSVSISIKYKYDI
jgi:hypothetical protein